MKTALLASFMSMLTIPLVARPAAQTTPVRPCRVEFVASVDHAVLDGSTPRLTAYRLAVSGPMFIDKDLGKPTPNATGVITVDVDELTTLAPGNYTASVEAYGPGGISAPATASFTVEMPALSPLPPSALKIVFESIEASTPALLGYWAFDEASGTVAGDKSGHHLDAALTSMAWIEGKVGRAAIRMTAMNGLGVTPSFAVGSTFTIAAWVNPWAGGQVSYARVVETGYPNVFIVGIGRNAASYKFVVNSGLGSTGTCGLALGCAEGGSVQPGWTHLVATYDGQVGRLYVDGGLVASDTFAPPAPGLWPLLIGRSTLQNAWRGAIDELRIYNRALSMQEIASTDW